MEKGYLDKHPEVIEAGRKHCREMYENVRKQQIQDEKRAKARRAVKVRQHAQQKKQSKVG